MLVYTWRLDNAICSSAWGDVQIFFLDLMDNTLKKKMFQLKGRLYTLTVLSLLDADLALFDQQLSDMIAMAPRLLENAPVVLDCTALNDEGLDLHGLCRRLRERGLMPVALQGSGERIEALAKENGLAVLNASGAHDKRLEPAPTPTVVRPMTKIMSAPVRSGQQVVNTEGDLIITGAISPGAELLAQGHIHVYGALRGRALAGINGQREARIFCQSLDAELVSIAGVYRLSDQMEPMTGPCQIYLLEDRIHIEAIA